MLEVTTENFEKEVIQSEVPVLVEFWASWCPPCKMMEPMIEKLAGEYDGQVKFVSINIDRNGEIADKMNVSGVPTFIVFDNGQASEDRLVGAQTRRKLKRIIDGE